MVRERDQWPIPYLLPFSDHAQWTWSKQGALNAWPNIVITAVLIGSSLLLARKRGFSPLELLSEKADVALVRVLWKRFPLTQ